MVSGLHGSVSKDLVRDNQVYLTGVELLTEPVAGETTRTHKSRVGNLDMTGHTISG